MSTPSPACNRALEAFAAKYPDYLADLCDLVRIPSVSFEGFPAEEVARSADATAALLKARGFENVQVLKLPGVHPYVYGDFLHAPGKPTVVKFTMPDVCHTFRPGHRLMVQVQSTWFPLVDRNPQTFTDIYKAEEKDFVKATHTVHRSGDKPSGITVRVVK